MKLFDATLFANKPALPASFIPIDHINENYIFDAIGLNETKLAQYLAKQGTSLVFLDIESQVWNTPEKWQQVVNAADRLGVAPFGFFGWPTIPWAGNAVGWGAWCDTYGAVIADTDTVFPCAYAYTTDPATWAQQLEAIIAKARQFTDKPIYPFLWFNYEGTPLKGKYVGDQFWRFMLNQCRRKADGCVIWGGGWPMPTWDDNAAWWRIVQRYL